MNYKRELKDILSDFVGQICLDINIYQVTPNVATPANWDLSVDDIRWAQIGYMLTIGSISWKITAIDDTPCANVITVAGIPAVNLNGLFTFENTGVLTQPAGSIVITGGTTIATPALANFPFTGNLVFTGGIDNVIDPNDFTVDGGIVNFSPPTGIFQIYAPQFFHGTPNAIDSESIQKINKPSDVFPMVWLWDPPRETFERDPESAIERESQIRLFFLTNANFTDTDTPTIYDNYEKPMRKLMENFKKVIDTPGSGVYKWEQNDVETPYARFGIYAIKGQDKSMFSASASGVEMDITLMLYKKYICCNS